MELIPYTSLNPQPLTYHFGPGAWHAEAMERQIERRGIYRVDHGLCRLVVAHTQEQRDEFRALAIARRDAEYAHGD